MTNGKSVAISHVLAQKEDTINISWLGCLRQNILAAASDLEPFFESAASKIALIKQQQQLQPSPNQHSLEKGIQQKKIRGVTASLHSCVHHNTMGRGSFM